MIGSNSNYAVVINSNAGRVTKRLTNQLMSTVPSDKLFLTTSILHARDVVEHCIEQGVETIFAGGGDGTIVDTVNNVHEFATRQSLTRQEEQCFLPKVGALRLGTGNALAHWLGSGSPVADLQRFTSGQNFGLTQATMIESEDNLLPFASLGIDAAVLNDYNKLKRRGKNRWWSGLSSGMSGYVMAGYSRTLPQLINQERQGRPIVKVINIGRPAFRIDSNGEEIGEPIPTGAVLYEGTSSVVAYGSTPFYGYQMKMFPFALKRNGRFQMRIFDMSPWQVALNIWNNWSGNFFHPDIHNFYVDRVRVVFDRSMPYQLGGEAAGYRKDLTFGLSRTPTTLLTQRN